MAWIVLVLAALFEIGGAISIKYSEGYTRLVPTLAAIVTMTLSMGLLGLAVRTLPIGTGYAVWTGLGTAGAALLGVVLFGESMDFVRLACIGLIIIGIIGLKLASPA
jgi:quaternary ammonium compound-resistance protein SugE